MTVIGKTKVGQRATAETALMLQLCRALRDRINLAAVTNDIFTREDGEFLTRNGALPAERIRAVVAAGGAIACDLAPSTWSVREDAAPAGEAGLPAGLRLRVVVAALADGTTWSAVHRGDEDGYVLGAALLPEISEALVQTLQPGA